MSEPISTERFAVLVERAGLKLTPEQFEELRQATGLSSAWANRHAEHLAPTHRC